MIVIAGYFRVPKAALAEMAPYVSAYVAAVRAEPGCREFTFAYDAVDPELIRAFEIYEDRAAFEAHGRTPHLAAWKETRARFGVTERNINLYAVSSVEPV
jgi:quinol monooxygenase YgiN